MNKLLLLFLCQLLAMGVAFATEYTIEGSVDASDGTIFYMLDYDTDVNIDSAFVVGGQLRFKGSYSRPAYVRIENEMGNIYSNCVLDTLAILDFNTHFPSGGSALNKKLLEYHSKEQKINDELALFYRELQSHGFEQPELGELYSHLFDKLRPKKLELYYSTIAESPDGVGEAAVMSLNSLWALTPDQWDTAYSHMPPYLKERKNVKEFNGKYNNLRKSQPGRPFIDFKGKTIEGKEGKLSDYAGKGKFVLVDFWASWCRPCKEEAEKTLRPLYEKYKDDDRFMILGAATWDEPENTVAALDKLKYPWAQIIGTGMTPMKLYGFDAIPQIMLIGPDGTILYRDLRDEAVIKAVDSELKKQQ